MRIRDEGIGITADMLPHVFDLFKQAGHSPHHAQGLGVGLALVRHIVELHGGRVSLQSAGVDLGSEFIVSLPLLPAPRSPLTTPSLSPQEATPAPVMTAWILASPGPRRRSHEGHRSVFVRARA